MSTRSTIWIRNNDGTHSGVYCHFDGYLSGVGKTLQEHYNSEEKIRDLLALGNLSSLGSPEDTCAYCRDRGEDLSNLDRFFGRQLQEYNYVWKNSEWNVSFNDRTELFRLTQGIIDGTGEYEPTQG